jgi:hypothetical protein
MPDPGFIGNLVIDSIGILALVVVWVVIIAIILFAYDIFKLNKKD